MTDWTDATWPAWITPTIASEVTANGRQTNVIIEPPELAGLQVVSVYGRACRQLANESGRELCGLVSGHIGPHWLCSDVLVDLVGPIAIVRDVTTGRDQAGRATAPAAERAASRDQSA